MLLYEKCYPNNLICCAKTKVNTIKEFGSQKISSNNVLKKT